jgi:D-alanine-D-alanine ligase
MLSMPCDVRLRIAVLSGGDSAEREISLRSGHAVAAALATAGHRATLVDPAECTLDEVDWSTFDACFVALHGGAGEDGRVQRQLEHLGVPYTGSGPRACQLAMSKSVAKERFVEFRVPTAPFVVIDAEDSQEHVAQRVAELGYPLIVKPDSQGSSLGVSFVEREEDLARAVAKSRHFDGTCIAEAFVRGREFTVAVLDDRPLPLVEILSPERVFSYEAKYASSLTEYRFDFDLPATKRAEILHAAVAAARALATAGLARVDVMLGHDGGVWVLEVNTIPGMTPRSLAPQAALAAGIDMPTLCDLLVRQCLVTTGIS